MGVGKSVGGRTEGMVGGGESVEGRRVVLLEVERTLYFSRIFSSSLSVERRLSLSLSSPTNHLAKRINMPLLRTRNFVSFEQGGG